MESCQQISNDSTMVQLIPVPQWSFLCFPHRIGLIILACIKLVLNLGLLYKLSILLYQFLFDNPILLFNIIIWITLLIDIVEISIGLAIIIAVCMNNQKIMRMYYNYSMFVYGSLVFMYCIILTISEDIIYILILLFIVFLILVLQEYLNYIMKIEVLKLESSGQSQL